MTKDVPLVSIVLATRNGARYLPEALDSMEAQTFSDWELVVVDDGSTDETPAILNSYHRRLGDGRMKVIRNAENIGLTTSLNRGLSAAQGQFVARMDDDDLAHPQRLEKQVRAMKSDPRLLLLGTSGYRLNETTGVRTPFFKSYDSVTLRMLLCWFNPFMHASVMFRRQMKDGSPVRYDAEYQTAQDYALWATLSLAGRVGILPDMLMTYRERAGSITVSRRDLQVASTRAVSLWYTRAFTDGTVLAGVTPEQVRSWMEDAGVPDRQRIENVRQLFRLAARPAFMRKGEDMRALMDWAAPCLNAGTWGQLMVGDSRRLLLCAGLGQTLRYAARRIAMR